MAESMHEAVWAWLMTCPHIKNIYFNFARANNGDTILVPMTAGGDTVVREYTSGMSERRYNFALVRLAAISDAPNSTDNIETLLDTERLTEWVTEQSMAGAFPVLPEGCEVIDVAVYPPGSEYFAARNDGQAKYMFQFHIDYLKKER